MLTRRPSLFASGMVGGLLGMHQRRHRMSLLRFPLRPPTRRFDQKSLIATPQYTGKPLTGSSRRASTARCHRRVGSIKGRSSRRRNRTGLDAMGGGQHRDDCRDLHRRRHNARFPAAIAGWTEMADFIGSDQRRDCRCLERRAGVAPPDRDEPRWRRDGSPYAFRVAASLLT